MNVGIATVVEFLQKKGYTVEANPNTKISEEQYAILVKEFSTDKNLRLESERFIQERQNKDRNKASVSIEGFEKQQEKPKSEDVIKTVVPEDARPKFKPVGKIDLDKLNGRKTDKVEKEPEQKKETVVERPVVERPIVAERPVVEPEVKKEPEKKEPEVKKEEVVAPAPTPAEPVVVKQPEPVAEPKPAEVEKVVVEEVIKEEPKKVEAPVKAEELGGSVRTGIQRQDITIGIRIVETSHKRCETGLFVVRICPLPQTDCTGLQIVVAELIRAEIADCGIISRVRFFLEFG